MMIMMMVMTMMIGLQESELLGTPPGALWSKLCPNSDREAPRRHGSPPPRRHGSPPPPCQAPTPACVLCPRDVPDGTIAISPTAWRASLRAVSFLLFCGLRCQLSTPPEALWSKLCPIPIGRRRVVMGARRLVVMGARRRRAKRPRPLACFVHAMSPTAPSPPRRHGSPHHRAGTPALG